MRKSLAKIEIPAGVELLGERSFYGCESLLHVTFPGESCLKMIEKEAFAECKNLRKIEIPVSVEVLGEESFALLAYLRVRHVSIVRTSERSCESLLG